MKLKFRTNSSFPKKYNGAIIWFNGDVNDVPDTEAKRLLADFPDNFFKEESKSAPVIEEPKSEEVKEDEEEKAEEKPKNNKLFQKPGKNK